VATKKNEREGDLHETGSNAPQIGSKEADLELLTVLFRMALKYHPGGVSTGLICTGGGDESQKEARGLCVWRDHTPGDGGDHAIIVRGRELPSWLIEGICEAAQLGEYARHLLLAEKNVRTLNKRGPDALRVREIGDYNSVLEKST